LGGFPGPLRELLGIWAEEIDALYPGETRRLTVLPDNILGLEGSFVLRDLWESVHLEGARELARFEGDIFDGRPALTVNAYGKGKAYHLASRNEEVFLDSFYGALLRESKVRGAWPSDEALPEGVSVTVREGEQASFYFVLNFADGPRTLTMPDSLTDATLLAGFLGPAGAEGRSDGKILHLPQRGRAVLKLDRRA
jgi:beta-galactosidase